MSVSSMTNSSRGRSVPGRRRGVSLLFALGLTVGLAACGSDAAQNASPVREPSAPVQASTSAPETPSPSGEPQTPETPSSSGEPQASEEPPGALPMETELTTGRGYSVTLTVPEVWTPTVGLGDPGKMELVGDPDAPVLGELTNTTVGGRPVAFGGSTNDVFLDAYWSVSGELHDALCEMDSNDYAVDCAEDELRFLRSIAIHQNKTSDPTSIEGDGSVVIDFARTKAAFVPAAAGFGSSEFPEAEQQTVDSMLSEAPDFVVLRIPTAWVADGITDGGSCIGPTGSRGTDEVTAVFDGRSGAMLSDSEARDAGLGCRQSEGS